MSSVHPQVKALLERVARSPLPPYHTVPAFVARRIYRDSRAAMSPTGKAKVSSGPTSKRQVSAPPVPATWKLSVSPSFLGLACSSPASCRNRLNRSCAPS